MKAITVFTPAFNRAHTLTRAYEAAQRQTNKNFIWLIVDDGSTDNTKELVEGWLSDDNDFEIKYIYKKNGGLHTGYNCAIENSETELMFCVDSDDFMPDDAIDKILSFWQQNGTNDYAGIIGLDYDLNGLPIRDKLPNLKSIDLIALITGKYKIYNGDRAYVIRTDLYKQIAPMKSFNNEKNFNPNYMHFEIAKDYKFLVLNENIKFVEYQEGGMSDSVFKQYYNSPNSFIEIRKQYLGFKNAPFLFKLKNTIHYISSCIIARKKHFIRECPEKILCALLLAPGLMFSMYVKQKGKD